MLCAGWPCQNVLHSQLLVCVTRHGLLIGRGQVLLYTVHLLCISNVSELILPAPQRCTRVNSSNYFLKLRRHPE